MESRDRRKAKAATGPPNPEIPDKLYFRIGEVATLLGVEAYVLRFWEAEFPQLNPTKSGAGQRLYRRRDVEMALRIKRLLYSEGYTIPGARQQLKAEARERQTDLPLAPAVERKPHMQMLNRMRTELKELASLLARPLPGTRRVPRTERDANRRGLHLTERRPAEGTHAEKEQSSGDETAR